MLADEKRQQRDRVGATADDKVRELLQMHARILVPREVEDFEDILAFNDKNEVDDISASAESTE